MKLSTGTRTRMEASIWRALFGARGNHTSFVYPSVRERWHEMDSLLGPDPGRKSKREAIVFGSAASWRWAANLASFCLLLIQ